MNKAELTKSIATGAEVSYELARKMLDAFQQTIENALVHGDKVSIRGLGAFVVSDHSARYYHHPLTGEAKMARAFRSVRFVASKQLRDLLN
ncbi:HU family DNA-binding protein [Alicyclobacillus mengziensis]|uniref:HU family DNA-binding protein n=1 Tax=Alicyclobacillus mengziensis TaxID=2931921 RepID=A0A9X7W2W5_9BACL|nr:HU family DNA-binding protein [Alicyclobacillus mengziensis]QSO49182.1 HU family DNA-binding protein [Alicyclobacillus mengziensis]